jgi:DNA-directed RNA polymerase specialized sigma24 family protein
MSLMKSSLVKIETVYRERGGDFFRLALADTGEQEQARDAVQEGFARAIRGRGSYRASGSLEAWVARCVINAAHDAARAGRRSPVSVDDPLQAASTMLWTRS